MYRSLLIVAVLVPLAVAGTIQPPDSNQEKLRRLFEDSKTLNSLSIPAREFLTRKFGRRPDAEQPSGQPHSSLKTLLRDSASSRLAQLLPGVNPGNTQVNSPYRDSSRWDTQTNGVVIPGSGNSVIAAFLDTSLMQTGRHATSLSHSSDGGRSFSIAGGLPDTAGGDAGLACLAKNAAGEIFMSNPTASFDRVQVYKAADDGATWSFLASATPVFNSGGIIDRPWIAIDTSSGTIYLTFTSFGSGQDGLYICRSTDRGVTWSSPKIIAARGNASQVVVRPDGGVGVVYIDFSQSSERIMYQFSDDGAATFSTPMRIVSLQSHGQLDLDGGLQVADSPSAAVDPSTGNLFVTWNDTGIKSDAADIYLSFSIDGGATWAAPSRINDDTTANDQFLPSMAAAPDGRIFVSFYDRRQDPGNLRADRFGVIVSLTDAGDLTAGPNFAISDQNAPITPGHDPAFMNPRFFADYSQSAATDAFFYDIWSDFRNSDAFKKYQSDVYFDRIPAGGPGGVPRINSWSITGGSADGTINANECSNLTFEIQNLGTAPLANGTAELSTDTPDVTIAQPTTFYYNLDPGASGTAAIPFRVATSETFSCLNDVSLMLNLATSDGIFPRPFTIPSGSAIPLQFDNANAAAIPDNSPIGVDSVVQVDGIMGRIVDVTVSLHISHPNTRDLRLTLTAPDGTSIVLANRHGIGSDYGSSCSGNSKTTFSDDATLAIAAADPPFVGTFRPDESFFPILGTIGSAVNGDWKLNVADLGAVNTGTLECWALSFTVSTCYSGGGSCAPCIYSLSETGMKFASEGGTQQVTINSETSCVWIATSNADWISIVTGSLGTGNGVMDYSVAANNGPARTGTITIAGQTYTVTQAGVDSSVNERIVIGLGPFAGNGGWFEQRAGLGGSFGFGGWSQLPWPAYNMMGGGVHVAAGDIDGDGMDEIVAGAGTGGGGWMAIFDDALHGYALLKWIQVGFPSYNTTNGEVFPAVGDVNGDGRADIVAGLGAGGGGWAQVFLAVNSQDLVQPDQWIHVSLLPDAAGDGSTHPAVGDLDGDGSAEIVLGLGKNSGGWLEVLNSKAGHYGHNAWLQVNWPDYNAINGTTYPAIGDINGDGKSEIVVGLGAGGSGWLEIFGGGTSGFAPQQWLQVPWAIYNSGVGESHPAVGKVRDGAAAQIVVGLAPFPGYGGWFLILDDALHGYQLLGWRQVEWAAFQQAGGDTWPAVGRLR